MTLSSRWKSNRIISRLEHAASSVVVASVFFSPGSAQAETRAWINTSLSAEIATNPYLQGGSKTSAATGLLTVSPGVEFVDAVKTISLTGDFRHQEFSRNYRSADDYSVNASLRTLFARRLNYDATISYDNAVVGANNLLTFGANPTNGGLVPAPPGGITLNGLGQRREAISGDVGLNYTASARDSLQTRGGFSFVRFPSASVAREYNDASASIGYSRILNSRITIGLNLSVSRADYLRTLIGDATTISPQATFSTKFGPNWTLVAALGVSHSTVYRLTGKSGQNSASGRLVLCNVTSRVKFCVRGSRSVQPTSLGNGVRPQTSIGASYNLRLDSNSTIDATANITRSSQFNQGTVTTNGSVAYGQASLKYSRRISQRLDAFVTGSYANSYNDAVPRKANSLISVGISYTFGDMK